MPTLIKEDGTRPANANAYASVADADAYVDSRPYGATEWAAQTADGKARCLITATVMIDSFFQFTGRKAGTPQALQWPRAYAVNPDASGYNPDSPFTGLGTSEGYFATNEIPTDLLRATCEQALQLALGDRTAPAAGEGLRAVEIFQAIKVEFDKSAEQSPQIPSMVQAMLSRIGSYQSTKSGAVKLRRT